MSTAIAYPNREAWEAHRVEGLGASEVAAALGVHPHKSAYTLWAEKSGYLPKPDYSLPMRLGHMLEPVVSELYEQETGRKVSDPGDFTTFNNPAWPWLFATPDRFIAEAEQGEGLLEIKTTGSYSRIEWETDIPLHVQVQLQTQLAVCERGWGEVAALVGNEALICSGAIDRDERFINAMMPRLEEFWDRVVNKTPPPVDGSESTSKTLKALHPDDNGESVDLTREAWQAALRIREINCEAKALEVEKRELQNLVVGCIGNATFGRYAGLEVSYKTQERASYVAKASKFRVMRIKEAK